MLRLRRLAVPGLALAFASGCGASTVSTRSVETTDADAAGDTGASGGTGNDVPPSPDPCTAMAYPAPEIFFFAPEPTSPLTRIDDIMCEQTELTVGPQQASLSLACTSPQADFDMLVRWDPDALGVPSGFDDGALSVYYDVEGSVGTGEHRALAIHGADGDVLFGYSQFERITWDTSPLAFTLSPTDCPSVPGGCTGSMLVGELKVSAGGDALTLSPFDAGEVGGYRIRTGRIEYTDPDGPDFCDWPSYDTEVFVAYARQTP